MVTLMETLARDLTTNLKAKNTLGVTVLRHTLGEIQKLEKGTMGAKPVVFDDAKTQETIARFVKQRRATAAEFESLGKLDAAAKENAEADFLMQYIPEAVSETEIAIIAEAVVAAHRAENGGAEVTGRDFGAIMKEVMAQAKAKGSVDGKVVSATVKRVIG